MLPFATTPVETPASPPSLLIASATQIPAARPRVAPHVGYTLDSDNQLVISDEHAIDAIEILIEAGATHPPVKNFLTSSPEESPHHFPLINLRTQRLVFGGLRSTPGGDPELLQAMVRIHQASSVSHQLTLPIESVTGVCHQVDWLQKQLGSCPFFLGFTAGPDARQTQLCVEEFRRVIVATGCGITLDLTDLLASCQQNHLEAFTLASELLSDAANAQLLINGALPASERSDSSSSAIIPHRASPVPHAVWELYRDLLAVAFPRIQAVFVTRRQNHPDEYGWRADLRRARSTMELFRLAPASSSTIVSSRAAVVAPSTTTRDFTARENQELQLQPTS